MKSRLSLMISLTLVIGTAVAAGSLSMSGYPRVDGSTSAHPLQVVIACKAVGCSFGWEIDRKTRRRNAVPYSKDPLLEKKIKEKIVHNGTHGAYENLIEGKADLILVARKPSADEMALAESLSVKMAIEPVALDAFVFIAHSFNPIESLSEEEIKGIYTGKITSWKSLGWVDSTIRAYQRNANSGSQELMNRLVLSKDRIIKPSKELILFGMGGPFNSLARDSLGIGYTVYFYKEYMTISPHVKMLAVDKVAPTSENIQKKKYPYWTEVYCVTRGKMSKPAHELKEWIRSPEGTKAIKESGYVPID